MCPHLYTRVCVRTCVVRERDAGERGGTVGRLQSPMARKPGKRVKAKLTIRSRATNARIIRYIVLRLRVRCKPRRVKRFIVFLIAEGCSVLQVCRISRDHTRNLDYSAGLTTFTYINRLRMRQTLDQISACNDAVDATRASNRKSLVTVVYVIYFVSTMKSFPHDPVSGLSPL